MQVHTKTFTVSKYLGVYFSSNSLDKSLPANVPLYVWKTAMKAKISIAEEGWHSVAFQICNKVSGTSDTDNNDDIIDTVFQYGQLDGRVIFRNPYGYIPAEMYGFLPFEAARMIAYVLLGIILIYYYCRYSDSVLNLHKAVFAVYIIAFVESIVWFTSYQTINITGEPYCCPFPSLVVASLILQIFRQTFSRTLLLVVALGYGIVRPKLLQTEWLSIFAISVLYFTAATVAQVSEIILTHDIHTDSSNNNSNNNFIQYEIPALIMDAIFLSWIFLALSSTQRILIEFRQTYKLGMYNKLTASIILFATLFGIVTIFALLDKYNVIQWPWQWTWLQQVLW